MIGHVNFQTRKMTVFFPIDSELRESTRYEIPVRTQRRNHRHNRNVGQLVSIQISCFYHDFESNRSERSLRSIEVISTEIGRVLAWSVGGPISMALAVTPLRTAKQTISLHFSGNTVHAGRARQRAGRAEEGKPRSIHFHSAG